MSHENPLIIEAGAANFEQEVIERSRKVPVLVDFWASWCAPCRTLGPLLEKLAKEYQGRFVLAKVDTERDPNLAAAFGVRGIPAVYGLRNGQVQGQFVGVQSEAYLREFIDGLMPSELETRIAEGETLLATNPEAAEGRYREALQLDPNAAMAKIGLARALQAQGRPEESRALLQELERRGFLEPEAERLKAELTIQDHAEQVGGVAEARQALSASPEDLNLRYRLAEALAAESEYPEALEICLDLIERDRRGLGESARELMLAIFQMLPADSELVADFRRRLSLVL